MKKRTTGFPVWAALVFGGFVLSGEAYGDGATRELPPAYDPLVPFSVVITIVPPPGTTVAGLEDSPPAGWTNVSGISNGGTYDEANHKVKWGPYFTPSIPAMVSYMITPPAGAIGVQCFAGTASFNGFNQPIGGDACVGDVIPTISQWGGVVMTLLVVSAGTIVFARTQERRQSA